MDNTQCRDRSSQSHMCIPHRHCFVWMAVITCFSPTSDNFSQIRFVNDPTLERPSFPLYFFALFYFSSHLLLSTFLSPPSLVIPTHAQFRHILESALKHTQFPWKCSCYHVPKRTEKLTLELVPVRSKSDLENHSFLLLFSGSTYCTKTKHSWFRY